MTEAPNVAGFAARPVYGAMYCSCSTRPLFDFELFKKMQVCAGACGESEGERSGGSKQRAECEGQEGFRRGAPQVRAAEAGELMQPLPSPSPPPHLLSVPLLSQ